MKGNNKNTRMSIKRTRESYEGSVDDIIEQGENHEGNKGIAIATIEQ